jgi:hypothetical protein
MIETLKARVNGDEGWSGAAGFSPPHSFWK